LVHNLGFGEVEKEKIQIDMSKATAVIYFQDASGVQKAMNQTNGVLKIRQNTETLYLGVGVFRLGLILPTYTYFVNFHRQLLKWRMN